MKRKGLIVLLVILIIGFLAVAAGSVIYLTGNGVESIMDINGTVVFSESYQDILKIQADIKNGSIEVVTHSEDSVSVEVARIGFTTFSAPTASASDGVVRITQSGMPLGISLGGFHITVYVPRDAVLPYDLDSNSGSIKLYTAYETATLRTDSGSIKVEGSGTKLDVKTSSGSISVIGEGGDTNLKTSSGSIKVEGGGENLLADTSSGSIKVFDAFNTMELDTSSGSIRAAANTDTTYISAKTGSGSIKISLEDVSGYQLKASTGSGTIKDEYTGNTYENKATNTHGDGSLEIEAKTGSGSIRLTDWDD